jgi:hypothetical protein
VNEGVPVVDAVSEKLAVYWWLLPVHAIAPIVGVAVGPAALNVLFVKLFEVPESSVLHPVAVFTKIRVTAPEQMLGVTDSTTVCCPFFSVVDVTVAVPPVALTRSWLGTPGGNRLIPMMVTLVALPPGPESGVGPEVIVGLFAVNDPDADAVSPSERSVTVIPPPLAHPAGGFARIWVPVTERTVPCFPPNVTISGAMKP